MVISSDAEPRPSRISICCWRSTSNASYVISTASSNVSKWLCFDNAVVHPLLPHHDTAPCLLALRYRQGRVAVADADSPSIRVYVSDGSSDVVGEFSGHSQPVVALAYNEKFKTVVSADR